MTYIIIAPAVSLLPQQYVSCCCGTIVPKASSVHEAVNLQLVNRDVTHVPSHQELHETRFFSKRVIFVFMRRSSILANGYKDVSVVFGYAKPTCTQDSITLRVCTHIHMVIFIW